MKDAADASTKVGEPGDFERSNEDEFDHDSLTFDDDVSLTERSSNFKYVKYGWWTLKIVLAVS